MPSRSELSELEGQIKEMGAKVEGVHQLLTRMEHQTTLIHEHLLKGRSV
jgi:hypothetical protein